MLPLDERPIPDGFPDELVASIRIARALRASPALCAAEGLCCSEPDPAAFNDYTAQRYITSQFGADAWTQYLAGLPAVAALGDAGWRASPLSVAMSLGSDLVPGENFLYAPHLRIISNLVVRAVTGRGKRRLAIAMPYRHGKSALASIATPLWMLANFPHLSIGVCSHSESLASGFTRQVRNILAARENRFGFSLAPDSQSIHTFHTSLGGTVWQGSVGASIVGKGAELLVCDDIVAGTEAAGSLIQMDAAWAWLTSDALTRLQNAGVVLFVTTRYSEKDPYGRLQSGYDGTDASQWEFVSLPAIATVDDDLLGRKKGDALWPAKRPLSELESFRAGMSEESWLLGYQQETIERSGLGRCTPNFNPAVHVRDTGFDSALPIRLSFDFNVDGYSIIFAQFREYISSRMAWLLTNQRHYEITVLDELILQNTTTESACEIAGEKLRALGVHVPGRLKVRITGDASGAQRRTSGAGGAKGPQSDWDTVRSFFSKRSDLFETSFDIRSSNPSVKTRIDRVNTLLRNTSGQSLITISPKAKSLITDLRENRWARDSHGNALPVADKRDPARTHAADAFGYLIMSAAGGYASGGEREGSIF